MSGVCRRWRCLPDDEHYDSGMLISRTAVACCPDAAMDEINRTVGIGNYRENWGKLRQQMNYREAAAVISRDRIIRISSA